MPVPRVILKYPYLEGGSERAAFHLHNYIRYMATREGAQHVAIGHGQLPATEGQRKMVAQPLREFPLSHGLFGYEDYQTAPIRGNASEFIIRALEDSYDQIARRDSYVSYIASRPRAQRARVHTLFTGSDASLVLSQIAAEMARHPGNVWLPIISLRREDTTRLGYGSAGQWENLIAGYTMEMAEAIKVPWEQFRWYTALHDQGHYPHTHMVCYSADGRFGYLTREGITRIKSSLAERIFHQELHELYERQTQRRGGLTQEAEVIMAKLVQQIREGTLDNPGIEQFMGYLAGKLKGLSDKEQYGYLRVPLKAMVDEIVDKLARDERVARAYELWHEFQEKVLRTYREDLPPRLLLSRQREFKRIRNMVIEEALRLGYESTMFDPTASEEPPFERDIAEADREASKEPESSANIEHIEPEETRNHRDRLSNPYARYRLAKIILADPAVEQERFRTALKQLTEAAEAGLVHAQYELGKIYQDSRGVEKDALLAAV